MDGGEHSRGLSCNDGVGCSACVAHVDVDTLDAGPGCCSDGRHSGRSSTQNGNTRRNISAVGYRTSRIDNDTRQGSHIGVETELLIGLVVEEQRVAGARQCRVGIHHIGDLSGPILQRHRERQSKPRRISRGHVTVKLIFGEVFPVVAPVEPQNVIGGTMKGR